MKTATDVKTIAIYDKIVTRKARVVSACTFPYVVTKIFGATYKSTNQGIDKTKLTTRILTVRTSTVSPCTIGSHFKCNSSRFIRLLENILGARICPISE